MNFEMKRDSVNYEAVALPHRDKSGKRIPAVLGILALVMVAVVLLSLSTGRYGISIKQFAEIIVNRTFGGKTAQLSAAETVLFSIRIPRICVALMIGAALSLSGTAYQGLFLNPMVSPDILGASAGAGFGAAVAILFSMGILGMQLSAFIAAVAAVGLSYFLYLLIGRRRGLVLILVLTGMVVQSVFTALTTITKYVADPESKLPAISFWLMGTLNTVSWRDAGVMLGSLAVGGIPLFLFRYRINALSFGDDEAQSMGVDVKNLRIIIIICSTLLTATSVSISGLVGWVGLVIPHVGRLVVGPNYKSLIPASFLIGATFLLLADDLARNLFVTEIPLGILTAIIGAPFFLFLLLRKN